MRASSHVIVPWWWMFTLSCVDQRFCHHTPKNPTSSLLDVFFFPSPVYFSSDWGNWTVVPPLSYLKFPVRWFNSQSKFPLGGVFGGMSFGGHRWASLHTLLQWAKSFSDLKMFEPLTISVSHIMSIFVYAFAKLEQLPRHLGSFSVEPVRIFYTCARFFFS